MAHAAQPPPDAPRPSSDATALLAELARVIKGRRFYGPGSAQLAKVFERAVRAWQSDLERHGAFEVVVAEDGFVATGHSDEPLSGQLANLHGMFVQRGIQSLRVEVPLEAEGFAALLEVLVTDAARLGSDGGVERALYERAPVGFVVNGIAPPSHVTAAEPAANVTAPEPAADVTAAEPAGDVTPVEPAAAEPAPPEPEAPEPTEPTPTETIEQTAEPTTTEPTIEEPLATREPPAPDPELDLPIMRTAPEPAAQTLATPDPEATDPMLTVNLAPPEPAHEPADDDVTEPDAATDSPAVADDALPPIPTTLLEEAAEEAPAVADDAFEMDFADEAAPALSSEASELGDSLDLDPTRRSDAEADDECDVDPDADTLSRKAPLVVAPPEPETDGLPPHEDPAFSFMDEAPGNAAPVVESAPARAPRQIPDFDIEPLEDSSPNLDVAEFGFSDDASEPAPETTAPEPEPEIALDVDQEAESGFEAEVREVLDLDPDPDPEFETETETGNEAETGTDPEMPQFEIEGAPPVAVETAADAVALAPEPAEGDEIALDFGAEPLELEEAEAAAAPPRGDDLEIEAGGDDDEESLEFGFDDDARPPAIADAEMPDETPPSIPELAEEEPEPLETAEPAPEPDIQPDAAAPEAAAPEPATESPSYVFEVLGELEECDDPILYNELAQRASDAAARLIEKSFSAEAFTVLRTLAAHAGDGNKRSPDQRGTAQGHMLALARGPLQAELIQRACSEGDGSLEANQMLLRLGGDATLPVFKAAATERNAERRERLHSVLIALGEDSLPDLLRLMRESDPASVRTAVRLAGEIQNPGAVPRLAELLEQPVAALSQDVCKALVRIGDPAALKVLCDGLESDVEHVPALAAYGLGSSGSPIAGAALLQALHRAMEKNRSEFAREVIRALGRLGRPDATSDLANILLRGGLWQRRRHRELKLAAAASLGRLPGDEAVGALAQAAQSRDAHIRRAAQVALDRRAQALADS